jgi:hypothetical protein
MRKITVALIFFILTFEIACSQDSKIIMYGLELESFSIVDGFQKNCLLNKYVEDDTLIIEVFSQFLCEKIDGDIQLKNDTLILDAYNDFTEFEESSYDSITGQFTYSVTLREPLCCGYCAFILRFKTSSEFYNMPIKYKSKEICKCRDESQFEILGTDTINRMDKYGLKQGDWLEYHENGVLSKLEVYTNGKRQFGYEFNEEGKTIARIAATGSNEIRIQSMSDTIVFQEFPIAPEKYMFNK